jgi:hypothetical protein
MADRRPPRNVLNRLHAQEVSRHIGLDTATFAAVHAWACWVLTKLLLLLQARHGAGMLSWRHAVRRRSVEQVHFVQTLNSIVHARLDVVQRSPVVHVVRMALRGWSDT